MIGCVPRDRDRTERVNVSTAGDQADLPIMRAAVSADGRFVAFSSAAANLVANDRNGRADVFVRDLRRQTTTRVSVSSTGVEANGASYYPAISADGRVIAFRSYARNLVSGDGNGVEDVFVHDRATGRTERVSVATSGKEADAPSITSSVSADGTVVAFSTKASNLDRGDRNGVMDVYVRDRVQKRTIRATVSLEGETDGASEGSGISANGGLVVFRSYAANLVVGDTNGLPDVFVRDWRSGTTERVNVSSLGAEANAVTFRGSMSGDGRWVAFRSRANNLVAGDSNGALDVFERDRLTGRTRRVSVATGGIQADAAMFPATARANAFMSRAFLSTGGRFAAFGSRAGNLVDDDTNAAADVFVHDLHERRTIRVSVGTDGDEANGDSFVAGVSGDASVIVFTSSASNLVPGDTNRLRDAFVRTLGLSGARALCSWPGTSPRLR